MPRNADKVSAIVILVAMFAVAAWSRGRREARAARAAQPPASAQNGGAFKFVSPLPNGDWEEPAGDLANTRYSPLNQINTQNVKNLKPIAIFSTGITAGHEGQPLVVNNTMYVVTPYPNLVIAYNLKDLTGPIEWEYNPHPDPTSQGRACCDVVNRGAAYGGGKIVYQTLDNTVIALDAKTGKEDWSTKTGTPDMGQTSTGAPIIVKDKVYVGSSGGELGVRGKVTCLDLATGKLLWTAYSAGPDSDVRINSEFHPFYKNAQGANLGVTTWPHDQWKRGGGNPWGWISYDPETNLIFYGTGNPGVWNPDQRSGDNKWSCTIFARDADTGYARWAFQVEPHDHFDYDSIMENILIDMNWKGRMRKLLIHPGRNGFVMILDRETGELLSAEKFVDSTNWASGYDLKTGLPEVNPAKATRQNVMTTDICPSSTGGKEFVPSAISPRTGFLYIPAHNTCMDYEGLPANYIKGAAYLGADVKMYPGPGGYQGLFEAWDLKTEKPVWSIKDDQFPVYSGVLATGGDVVFYGTLEGWFRAVDARTGQMLWQFKTPSGIIGDPITYLGPDGHQYIAIYSGIGGWMGAAAFPDISLDDPTAALGITGAMQKIKLYSAPGDNVFIFGL